MGAVRTLLKKLGLVTRGSSENGLGVLRNKRRAARLPISMPVLVYGYEAGEPFTEHTESVNVSARGALLAISANVACWQKIVLTNLQTEEELQARVVRLIQSAGGQVLAGVEFVNDAPRFWRTGTSPLAEEY
ncbi:MAG TPA: PilZ domain-containing protein [Candidatus Acidoferrales bacterium]